MWAEESMNPIVLHKYHSPPLEELKASHDTPTKSKRGAANARGIHSTLG